MSCGETGGMSQKGIRKEGSRGDGFHVQESSSRGPVIGVLDFLVPIEPSQGYTRGSDCSLRGWRKEEI